MATATRERTTDSLSTVLEAGQVVTNSAELLTYERDGTLRGGQPEGVVLPRSLDDVIRVVRWATQTRTLLVPRGAGTGLSGGSVAEKGGVVVSFARMNRILEFDHVGGSFVTEPGITNLVVDETVKKLGLYFPPDPSSGRSATIGGNIAENSGGPHCFKYGVTTNYVNGLEVVLADGRTLQLGGRAMDYPEYDFISLFTGGEGTLGLITKATLRLMRNPPAVKTLMVAFDSVADAGNAVSAVIARGLMPATMEMMDQKMMGVIEAYVHVGLPVDAGAALIVEVDGYPDSLSPQMEEAIAILRDQKARQLHVAQTAEERDKLWFGRKSAFGAMARLAPSYYVLDGTVPRSQLANALTGIDGICDSLRLRVAYVFHAGDGNLHPLILIEDPYDQELLSRVYEAGHRIMELCLSMGGSITGEHGVGIEKREYMTLMYGADELRAMWDIKRLFDPGNLMNPGKVLPVTGPSTVTSNQPACTPPASPYAPASAEDAAEAMRAWTEMGRNIYIQAGGTKVTLPAEHNGHILATSSLRGISKYALEDLYVTVRAGTPLAELQAELARDGMWVPIVSPWSESTLGGILATNFNAPLRTRYGAIRDLVLASTVVLPDGRILRVGRPVVKNVAGYDLHKLFVGTYGTLGLITEATMRLLPLPRTRASLVVPFDDLRRGLDWGMQLLQVCLTVSALLVCRGCGGHLTLEQGNAPYRLIYTAEGVAEDVKAELVQARAVLQNGGASEIVESTQVSGNEVWANWVQAGATRGVTADLVRMGVGRKDLAQVIMTLAPDLNETPYCADVASGLLYIRGAKDLSRLQDAAQRVGGYAIRPATPHLGNGQDDACGYVPESLDFMLRLKARWDANGRLNPGLLFVS